MSALHSAHYFQQQELARALARPCPFSPDDWIAVRGGVCVVVCERERAGGGVKRDGRRGA